MSDDAKTMKCPACGDECRLVASTVSESAPACPASPDVRSGWLVQMSRELAECREELKLLRKREEESARALAECRAHAIALDETAAEHRPEAESWFMTLCAVGAALEDAGIQRGSIDDYAPGIRHLWTRTHQAEKALKSVSDALARAGVRVRDPDSGEMVWPSADRLGEAVLSLVRRMQE